MSWLWTVCQNRGAGPLERFLETSKDVQDIFQSATRLKTKTEAKNLISVNFTDLVSPESEPRDQGVKREESEILNAIA